MRRWLVLAFLGMTSGLGAAFWYSYWHQSENKSIASSSNIDDDLTNATIVKVGSTSIHQADVDFEYRFQKANIEDDPELSSIPDMKDGLDQHLAPLKERLLSEFVERKLLYEFLSKDRSFDLSRPELFTGCLLSWQEAVKNAERSRGLLVSRQDRERLKQRICEWDIIQKYVEDIVYADIQISESELKQHYLGHLGNYSRPEEVIIRQIVLGSEREANMVRGRVSGSNFDELAKKYSISPEAVNGGLLPAFAKGEMPRFFNVAFSMRLGEIRGVLKSTYGFHIIKLEAKIEPKQLAYQEVISKLRAEVLMQKQHEAYQKWLELAINSVSISSPVQLW